MVWVGVVLSMILMLIAGILFLVNNDKTLVDGSGWAIFIGLLCLALFFVMLYHIVVHRKTITICGKFLYNSTLFLSERLTAIIYIPIFVGLSFLFGLLIMFQYLAFSSSSDPKFD
jgi:hypothetical protein